MLKFRLRIDTVRKKPYYYDAYDIDIEDARAASKVFDGNKLAFALKSKNGSIEIFNVRNVVSIEYYEWEDVYEPCEDLPF